MLSLYLNDPINARDPSGLLEETPPLEHVVVTGRRAVQDRDEIKRIIEYYARALEDGCYGACLLQSYGNVLGAAYAAAEYLQVEHVVVTAKRRPKLTQLPWWLIPDPLAPGFEELAATVGEAYSSPACETAWSICAQRANQMIYGLGDPELGLKLAASCSVARDRCNYASKQVRTNPKVGGGIFFFPAVGTITMVKGKSDRLFVRPGASYGL